MSAQRLCANALSIVGHPAVLTPLALAAVSLREGPLSAPVFGAIGVAAFVVGYSALQVARGRWKDTDASVKQERVELNVFLVLLLGGAAALVWFTGQPAKVVTGFALTAAIVLCALALRNVLKLSLHVAFAAFSATLFWPDWPIVLAVATLALAIAWARLALHRHTMAEVCVGALTGATAGVLLALIAP